MLFSLLSSIAVAQDAPSAASGESLITNFLPIILIIAVFYFLLLRPQQKRAKEHKNMIAELSAGTKIITGGGIFGVIKEAKTGDKFIIVEIAPNIRIKIKRDTIVEVISDDIKVTEKEDAEKKSTTPALQKDIGVTKKSDNKSHSANNAARKGESKNKNKK